jgi:hypothetical protein
MSKIYPVLLAGGSGTRLWPLSRKSYPKQFSNLIGGHTLFQQSALRLTSSTFLEFAPHITLTNSDFRFIVGEQLQAVGIDPGTILMDLTPRGIRMHLGLSKPIYQRTAAYGHFGRAPDADGGFSWERTDLKDLLRSYF